MLKYVFIVTFLTLVSACSSSGGGSSSPTTGSVVGTWSYIYPSSGCEESYTYNSDGSWSEFSLDEKQSGTYTFDQTANTGGKYSLYMEITSDNGLSDCNGVSVNDTGTKGTVYVLFKNNNTVMEWYLNANSNTPDFIVTKK